MSHIADQSYPLSLVLHLAAKLLSVRFVANGVRLAVEQVEALQILQYASAALPAVPSGNAILADNFGSIRFASQQFCQVELLCKPRSFGTQERIQKERYILHSEAPSVCCILESHISTYHDMIVAHNSTVSISRGARYATIYKVLCVHEKEPDMQAHAIKCEEVEFEFSDRSGRVTCELLYISFGRSNELTIRAAAEEFRGKIYEAKKAMLVQYLQNIRQGDLVVYER
jgi:hypothetical protein